ncbi:hypothetical protein BGZ99_006945 [Dissophora globulifera]|uniref:F-box domain-containing protein n=1 Tax=Dissophora globulifera TaxID=979702 RepID=A0A9P6RD26_9FUNG|nr:hypothetical protein BGZ99_006945 [Dissophora globulifera]
MAHHSPCSPSSSSSSPSPSSSSSSPSSSPPSSSTSSASTSPLATPLDTTPARKRTAAGLNSTSPAASTSTTCTLSHLPLELQLLILSYVPYRSLAALSRLNRYWRGLTFQHDGLFWYRLCQKHGFLAPLPLPLSNDSAQHVRWTLDDALRHRPGLSRALLQSRGRLTATPLPPRRDVSTTTTTTTTPTPTSTSTPTQKQDYPSASNPTSSSLLDGRIDCWKDYFKAMLLLEREWITGKPTLKELHGHGEAVICVKALPLHDRIVSGDRLGYLKVWCAVTGACLKTFKHHMMGISSLAIQGDLVVSGSWDSTVIAWKQIKEAPYLKALKIIDLGEQIVSLDLDDNLDLAVGAISGIIKIISLKTYSLIDTFRSSTLPLCWSVSLSRTKVEATIGCNYHAWDRTSKQQVGFIGKVHSQNISCLCVDKVKRLVFTGCLDGKVRMFSRGSKPMLLRQFGGHRAGVRGMTLLDNMIITGSSDKVLSLFRIEVVY